MLALLNVGAGIVVMDVSDLATRLTKVELLTFLA
jgi:hypothetical protein